MQEFSLVKKLYFTKILVAHPDKGGDPATFRALQEAWEVIRELFDSERLPPSGFKHFFAGEGAAQSAGSDFGKRHEGPPESWEWFAEAAAETVPSYKCENAK